MKESLVLLLILFSTSLPSFACDKVEIEHDQQKVILCFDKKADRYLSPHCDNVQKCFFKKKIEVKYYANQSPGFSICYQIDGEPFFAKIPGKDVSVPLCKLGDDFVDEDTLILTYKNLSK